MRKQQEKKTAER